MEAGQLGHISSQQVSVGRWSCIWCGEWWSRWGCAGEGTVLRREAGAWGEDEGYTTLGDACSFTRRPRCSLT